MELCARSRSRLCCYQVPRPPPRARFFSRVASAPAPRQRRLLLRVRRQNPAVNCSNAIWNGGSQDSAVDEETSRFGPRWKWAMTVSYDGTKFSGWQSQPKAVTVQQTIADVLSKITRCTYRELALSAASRTDAGVHAWGQVVSFFTPFPFEHLDNLHVSLNSLLPPEVRIRDVQAVRTDFHVRYHPISKTYQYKAYVAPVMDPCQRSSALHLPYEINVAAIQEAASLLLGTHNYAAFANSSPKALLSPVREISSFEVNLWGPHLQLEVQGKSFLYKQVRNMVGLLLEIGKGILPSGVVSNVIASQSRKELAKFSSTAPGHGLYLISVNYDKAFFLDDPEASYGRFRQLKLRSRAPS